MIESTGRVVLQITHVNDSKDHIVALDRNRKWAIGIYVADAKDCLLSEIILSDATVKTDSECAVRFYNTYKISESSPYESSWRYLELDTDSVLYEKDIPFIPIPVAKQEKKNKLLSLAVPGSRWKDDKTTWIIQDSTIENLAGKSRQRVWITTEEGKRGQAVYADSLVSKYRYYA